MVISLFRKISIALTTVLLLTAIATGGTFRHVDDEEIVSIVQEGIELLKHKGKEAFSDINKRNGRFNRDNLLLYVYDTDVTLMAHPKMVRHIGKNLKGSPDVEGKKYRDEIVEKGLKGGGWTMYTYQEHEGHGLHFRKVYSNIVEHNGIKYIVAAETMLHEKTEAFMAEQKEQGHKQDHEDEHHH
jgi:signal transduction histidine kinase